MTSRISGGAAVIGLSTSAVASTTTILDVPLGTVVLNGYEADVTLQSIVVLTSAFVGLCGLLLAIVKFYRRK